MTFHVGWPQLIYLVLSLLGIVITLVNHGEPREGQYNVYSVIVGELLFIGLLWWGGFF